jgi:hypothetical protein
VQMVSISQETFSRLQSHAVPLVDSIESVINKALDALESVATDTATPSSVRAFNPDAPPSLSFTTVRSVVFEGVRHIPSETYWNSILTAAIREAAKRGMNAQQISALLIVNNVAGKKEDGGYKYVAEAGISVQGQDANAAWKAAYHLATALNLSIEVSFAWQHNPKAAYPGQSGTFSVKGKP